MLHEDQQFERHWRRSGQQQGAEHDVYFDPATQRWFKRNVEHERTLLPIVSPPHVRAVRGARREEVCCLMGEAGFTPVGTASRPDDCHHLVLGIEVNDPHDENALVSASGEIVIFDPVPMLMWDGKLARLMAWASKGEANAHGAT
jgi:hypothetical protein